jgi:protein-disulfide isomerase
MTRLVRSIALAVAAVLAFSAAASAKSAEKVAAPSKAAPATASGDNFLGSAKAPVTVIEYASVTCPHCARWEAEVFPAFKAKYIDTGKVRYAMRELPTAPADLAEAGFLIARCAGGTKYYDVIEALMADQKTLLETGDGGAWLYRGGAVAGLSEPQVKACVEDPKAQAVLGARIEANAKADKIEGTPTFLVNGQKIGDGEVTLADLDKAIADAQKAPPKLRGAQPATAKARRKAS